MKLNELNDQEFLTSTNPHMGYHIAPPHGLINDPQGLIQFNGYYHIFHQWNPHGLVHKNKAWAHLISKDLVTWKDLPIALSPDQPYDKDGCYTGCAIVHDHQMYIFYTGNVRGENGERITHQCLVVSEDGFHFEKRGSIIEVPEGFTGHIRDPKVWKEDDTFYMILGAQTEDLKGTTLLYKSDDLVSWEMVGPFLNETIDLGYMWECPNFIQFEDGDVFEFSPQGMPPRGYEFNNIYQVGYYTGIFKNEQFQLDNTYLKELDHGFEFYAPQFFVDQNNRQLMFAWMGVMTPEKEQSLPTMKDGWAHILSLPRVITYKDGYLIQNPIEELKTLRDQKYSYDGLCSGELPSLECEIILENNEDSFTMNLRNEVFIEYNKENQLFSVTRTDWYDQSKESRKSILRHPCESLRIYVEDTSLEIFINNGEDVFSLRYFSKPNKDFSIETKQSNLQTTIYSLHVTNKK